MTSFFPITIPRAAYADIRHHLPRADLLREAVDQYLINQSQTARTSVPGIWQGCEEDGVEYQRKLREEW
ncbi:hypothetical protein ACUOAQ_02475 [Escherichia sp. SP-MK]